MEEKDKLVYDGFVKIVNHEAVVKGEKKVYDKLLLMGAVGGWVINEEGKIALVKQFRASMDQETLEIPAGVLDKKLPLKQIMIEELQEECFIPKENIVSMDDEPYMSYVMATGLSDAFIHLFMIKVKNAHDLVNTSTDEVDSVGFYTLEEIEELIKIKKINDAKTLMAYYYYKCMVK